MPTAAATPFARWAAGFAWAVPPVCNMAVDACLRWADGGGRLALIHVAGDGRPQRWSFDQIAAASARLANSLAALGVGAGERVAVLLPQRPETALAHLAGWRLGAITIPLFTLFGPEALAWRLADSAARVVVTDADGAARLAPLRDRLPALAHVLSVDGPGPQAQDLGALMARASDRHTPAATAPDTPALIIYTSGTTGPPKGALHGHSVLRGHMPGVELSHDLMPQPGDCFWTPADWAWIGGLFDVLLAAWFHGQPVVSHRQPKFDPLAAAALIERHGVRNVFLPPTALKLMRQQPGLAVSGLRSVASGGESLDAALLDWGRGAFGGLTINEFYGQTECNMIVSSCAALGQTRPGWMGRPVPGHRLAVVDGQDGSVRPDGAEGVIAVARPDPVMFLGYWNNPQATAARFRGDWMLTGDVGVMEDGFVRYVGREDDLISSAGYRIGPGEIEACLLAHPAVAMAAVVGVPDALRGQAIKAFIVLREDAGGAHESLASALQAWVRTRLAAHEYPRHIAFVESLPLTTTGKIMRRVLRDGGA